MTSQDIEMCLECGHGVDGHDLRAMDGCAGCDACIREGCSETQYNGLRCRRPVAGSVPVDFTHERRPVCKRHLRQED